MKQLVDITSNTGLVLVLGFLLLTPFSIAACYVLFTLLLVQLIVYTVNRVAQSRAAGKPQIFAPFPKMPPYFKYFMLYIAATVVSTIFSLDRMHSFKDNKEFFIYLLVPVFLLVLNTRKRVELSLTVVLSAALASSLWGILESLLHGVSIEHRLQGATSHWMTFSGLLMLPFIFFFVYFFYEKKKKRKLIIALSLTVILTVIFLSLTRSVWMGVLVGAGLFVVYYKSKIFYIAIPLLVIAVFVLPGSVKTRVLSIFDMNNATNKDRIYMAQIAFDIFKDHPVTGVGPNCIEKVYDSYKPAGAPQTNMHLHNNFLHVLAERGALGLLALLAAFIAVVFSLIKQMKRGSPLSSPLNRTAAVAVLFVFAAFLTAGMFEYNFGDSEMNFQLFFFLTLPFMTMKEDSNAQIDPTDHPESDAANNTANNETVNDDELETKSGASDDQLETSERDLRSI